MPGRRLRHLAVAFGALEDALCFGFVLGRLGVGQLHLALAGEIGGHCLVLLLLLPVEPVILAVVVLLGIGLLVFLRLRPIELQFLGLARGQ